MSAPNDCAIPAAASSITLEALTRLLECVFLRNGTSADRQRSVYQRALRSTGDTHAALADVVDQLLMETSQEPCASDDLQPALCES